MIAAVLSIALTGCAVEASTDPSPATDGSPGATSPATTLSVEALVGTYGWVDQILSDGTYLSDVGVASGPGGLILYLNDDMTIWVVGNHIIDSEGTWELAEGAIRLHVPGSADFRLDGALVVVDGERLIFPENPSVQNVRDVFERLDCFVYGVDLCTFVYWSTPGSDEMLTFLRDGTVARIDPAGDATTGRWEQKGSGGLTLTYDDGTTAQADVIESEGLTSLDVRTGGTTTTYVAVSP